MKNTEIILVRPSKYSKKRFCIEVTACDTSDEMDASHVGPCPGDGKHPHIGTILLARDIKRPGYGTMAAWAFRLAFRLALAVEPQSHHRVRDVGVSSWRVGHIACEIGKALVKLGIWD